MKLYILKKKKQILSLFTIVLLTSITTMNFFSNTVSAQPAPGFSEKNILLEEWHSDFYFYEGMYFGSSAAIAELGINNMGSEPDSDLEIVVGSDECYVPPDYSGYWRMFDSDGNVEWKISTQTDEARSSPAIGDIDNDGDLEIAGGTTSGWYVQVMDNAGNFIWTFPRLTGFQMGGPFVWPSSPALVDVVGNEDLEVIIGNRWLGNVWCFDGDNSDGIDEGISITQSDFPFSFPLGSEGVDWDVLWIFDSGYLYDQVIASPAVADVDNDFDLEVVIGSTGGSFYILDASDGSLEYEFQPGNGIYASAAIANLDSDSELEIVIGCLNHNIYCIEWDGTTLDTEWTYITGGPIYSSAAVGDVDSNRVLDIVVGSYDNYVYCLNGKTGALVWRCPTGSYVHSSPALFDCIRVNNHEREWSMFRNNLERTGFFGNRPNNELDVGLYIAIGSYDGYLYLICGKSGAIIDRFRTYGPIGTSPSVADVDGDKKLEVFFYDWGTGSIYGGHTFWAIEIDRTIALRAVDLALSLTDVPYLYGGKGMDLSDGSSKQFLSAEIIETGYYYYNPISEIIEWGQGIDCSGLVFWAYNRAYFEDRVMTNEEFSDRPLFYYGANGQSLSNVDFTRCNDVEEEDLLIGDLLFFDCERGRGPIDHVAMYIGGGFVVHSILNDENNGVISEPLDDVLEGLNSLHRGFVGYGTVKEAIQRG